MKFVKQEDLKIGMRLARPIYAKNGVLLFDRDSQLSNSTISSVKNFGLFGIYILEPAEPLPPMSEEDREFERFQTVMVAMIQEELDRIIATKHTKNSSNVSAQIIKKFGHLDSKINFYQNLRSRNDFVARHALNVAILCSMICHVMNVSIDEQDKIIHAALVHDIGRMKSKNEAVYGGEGNPGDRIRMFQETISAYDILEESFAAYGPAIKRICNQAIHTQMDIENGVDVSDRKMVMGAKILMVANKYDELTAMSLSGESISEVKAIKEFIDHPEWYDKEVVAALLSSVNILFPGVSVELNTGEKALVLTENVFNVLRPTVLCFKDNSILDLSLRSNSDIFVCDVMKTLDNRYIMNTEVLNNLGGD